MRKKTLLALLMAMTLMLSACGTLIVKDVAVDNATPILTLGDEVITKEQVITMRDRYLDLWASQYGIDPTEEQYIQVAQDSAVAALKEDLVLRTKTKELGLDTLTEEEEAAAAEAAETQFESDKALIQSIYFAETELEGEELDQAVIAQMEAMGVTHDSYVESARVEALDTKLKNYIVADVAVTDEEVETTFNSRVEADQATYAEAPGAWADAANKGTATLYYTPAGVRRVRQILIGLKTDDKSLITDARSDVVVANSAVSEAQSRVDAAQAAADLEGATEDDKAALAAAQADLAAAQEQQDACNAALQSAIDTAFANIEDETAEVLAAIEAGEDWDALVEKYNTDPGMKAGAANAEKGYAVAADMTSFDAAFVEAAMALANPGDVSGKVRGESYGYYIIRYESDEAEGPIALDAVKDAISAELLSTKQDDTYNATIDSWIESAGVKEDLNALKN